MRIEDMTPDNLKNKIKFPHREIYNLRHRFIQLYRNNFEGNDEEKVEGLERTVLFSKYRILRTEMWRRGYRSSVTAAIDIAAFKARMPWINVPNLGRIEVVKNYISITGRFLKTPKDAETVEVTIQALQEDQREALLEVIGDLIKSETGKEATFTFAPEGPTAEHIPIFDLILQSREKTEKAKGEGIPIQKPEVTETQIRIPVGSPCDVTATISIDADRGIQALYCGDEKRVRTYIFDKEKWTMATARAWIKDHKTKAGEDQTQLTAEKATTRHENILRNHAEFEKKPWVTVTREAQGKKYTVLMGHLKGQKTLTEMEYLYPTDIWSEAEARKHGKSHKAKRFSPAGKQDPHYHTSPLRKGLTPAQRKECDAETAKIKENEGKAKFPHLFKAAKFTHPNGHPRCLECGDEQPIGDVCGMPNKWYDKHDWDDEEAWKEEREKVDFSKAKTRAFFKFVKLDKKEQIVGGIIYEPDAVDSQGHFTDSEEIQKSMYNFMENYAKNSSRINIMHRGRMYEFPILETFQPEQDITKGNDTIKAGAWWVMIKVKSKAIWDKIERGELTGFSMEGQARS